jgi:hypothetical protein
VQGLLRGGAAWVSVPATIRELMGSEADVGADDGAGHDERIIAASLNSMTGSALELENTKVRKTPSWPRSWANFSTL